MLLFLSINKNAELGQLSCVVNLRLKLMHLSSLGSFRRLLWIDGSVQMRDAETIEISAILTEIGVTII
jgi:hypothetical protein